MHGGLLTKADERLDEHGRSKLLGLLAAGDPHGEVRNAWHAKETVRAIYQIDDPELAAEFVLRLGHDLQDADCPPEIQRLGRTIARWAAQISAWHQARVSNGPTEAANNLVKRVKRVAFGFTSFTNYRTRSLLYAGRPDWTRLAKITPTEIRRAAKPQGRAVTADVVAMNDLHWSDPPCNIAMAVAAGIVGMVIMGFTAEVEQSAGELLMAGVISAVGWFFTVGVFVNSRNERRRERIMRADIVRRNGGVYVNEHGWEIGE